MNSLEIIRESIYIPLNNTRGWTVITLICFILGLFQQFATQFPDYAVVFHLLSLITCIFLAGISLNIIKQRINGLRQYEVILISETFIDGIKLIILEIIYYVIPTILVLILALITGVFSNTEKFIQSLNTTEIATADSLALFNVVPHNVATDLFVSIGIVAIGAFIFFVIFALLHIIAQAKLAESDDLFAAVDILNVIAKITQIGWENYIVFIILLLILVFIIGLISGLISLIPYVGTIISSALCGSYSIMVISTAIGLIYLEG